MKAHLVSWAVAGLLLSSPASGRTAFFTFTPIDFPGAEATEATSINDAGQIVGRFLPMPAAIC